MEAALANTSLMQSCSRPNWCNVFSITNQEQQTYWRRNTSHFSMSTAVPVPLTLASSGSAKDHSLLYSPVVPKELAMAR